MAEQRRGLVIVYTGNGKGKTTAALGLLLRAWGRDLRVCMLSFIKPVTSNTGEVRAGRKLGIEMLSLGAGFTWRSRDIEADKRLAREGWSVCEEKLRGGYDVVVLDEITHVLNLGWLSLDEVIAALKRRPATMTAVLTGRDAPPALVDFADLVTEMREVKHPFATTGLKAQPGVDF